MTGIRGVTLYCEGPRCAEWILVPRAWTVAAARRRARRASGSRLAWSVSAGRDLCGTCTRPTE